MDGASRVGACARLSLAREQERRRATQEPLVVPWRERRARDGQVVISLCSSSSSSSSEDDGGADEEGEEDDGEEDSDNNDCVSTRKHGVDTLPTRSPAYNFTPLIKHELPRGGGNVLDVMSAQRDLRAADDGESGAVVDAGESSESDAVDVDLTSDVDDCEGTENVKAETPADSLSDNGGWSPRPAPTSASPGAGRALSNGAAVSAPVRSVASRHRRLAATSASEWCVRKMDEVNAAFLLFYGERETPSVSVLRMIIDLIAANVGTTDAYKARFIKHVAWQKLNALVDANVKESRAMQSEWMKIVFEEEPPRRRRRWGPMSRMPLLKRPVQITVRSMQFGTSSNPLQNQSSARGRSARAAKSAKKEPSSNKQGSLVDWGSPSKDGLPPRKGSSVKQGTATKRPLAPSREFVGSSPTVSAAPSVSSPPFTPRKQHKRNGSASPPPVTPRQILGAKGPGGRSISHSLMEPLPFGIRTLGANRSLPDDWSEEDIEAFRHSAQRLPLEVDPLRHMTARELAEHIKSVRREGRVENFEYAGEMLAKLMSHPRNVQGLFNAPVDPVALGLDTYTAIVKNPMDLGTVKARMARGEYVEMDDFAADVRLVFENAMLFNPRSHYVHVNAGVLLELFEKAMHSERERQSKRANASRHICLVCRGHQCNMCQQHCLSFAAPHLQCSGGCAADFRRGSVYYSTRDGTRVYCQKCKSRMDKEGDGGDRLGLKRARGPPSAGDEDGESAASSQASAEDPIAPSALVKHKCEVGVEPWVRCSDCDKWLHQVCGLYNPVLGVYAREHKYVCPLCLWRRKTAAQPPGSQLLAGEPAGGGLDPAASPSWGEALEGRGRDSRASPVADGTSGESGSSVGSGSSGSSGSGSGDGADAASDCAWASGANIPPCELSDFIQAFLARELRAAGEPGAAESLYVRALAFPHERMRVSDGVFRAFAENSDALAQARPGERARAAEQRLPRHISYLSRSLYLFQKHDGVDVCLFALYAQEFGDACELAANRRAVYIAYLDSVRYLSPPSARTTAYHLIMLAYLDYLRRHGFHTVHIWSCPPQKRISYVFWCRPPFQKTPSADHLRLWYKNLLEKAKARHIVAGWTSTFDRYFSTAIPASSSSAAAPSSSSSSSSSPSLSSSLSLSSSTATATATGGGMATRGVTARSVDPDELEWPARLPPLFDGDLIPAELERVLGRVAARNEKLSRAASASPFVGKGAVGATGGKRVTAAGEPAGEPAPHVGVRLREVFAKCQTAVRNLRHDLLVVDLALGGAGGAGGAGDAAALPCRPEALAPGWAARAPRFLGSRFMFHQLCSHAGYQFDSLRRAKHSTMMVLHHCFNERAAVQTNVFCRECSLLLTRAARWACAVCPGLALCDACHARVGAQHAHAMRFARPCAAACAALE